MFVKMFGKPRIKPNSMRTVLKRVNTNHDASYLPRIAKSSTNHRSSIGIEMLTTNCTPLSIIP